LSALLVLERPGGAFAQPASLSRTSNWELNLHAATLRPDLFDESSGALQFGGRIFRNLGSGLSLGANVDWARTSDVTVAPFEGLSASLILYSAEIGYDIRVSPRAVFHLGAGVGQAKLDIDRPLAAGAESNSTGLLIPAGGGIKIHNREVSPTWAIRFDARDNVILLETLSSDGGTETEPRHNIEASVGLSFLFGGSARAERVEPRVAGPAPQEEPAVRAEGQAEPADAVAEPEAPDEDGDGVADFEDGCPGTPIGVDVGADGCAFEPAREAEPGAADSDGDGVPDASDACPGTPSGIPIDDRGCLARVAPQEEPGEEDQDEPAAFPVPIAPDARDAPPAAAGACLDKSAGDRAIEFDGRRFEPAGFPQPVDRTFLVQVGTSDGIPLFVSDTAVPPYGDFWVPICGETGIYDLYVEAGAIP
jgi:hypothetical protein